MLNCCAISATFGITIRRFNFQTLWEVVIADTDEKPMIVAMKIDIGDLRVGRAIMVMTMMTLVMPMKIDIDDLQIGRNDDRWLLENPQSPEIPQSTAR